MLITRMGAFYMVPTSCALAMKRYREEAIRTPEWKDHLKGFQPLVLESLHLDKEMQFQSLLAFLLQDSTVIDISCIAKDEVEYKGNPIDRESINLPERLIGC